MFGKLLKKQTKEEAQQIKNVLLQHTKVYIASCENNINKVTSAREKRNLEIQKSYFETIKQLLEND